MDATEMGFLLTRRAYKYARFRSKKKPRQKSRNAAAWASFAPLPLHCRNCLGEIHMPPILALSEGEGGGEVIEKIGRGAHLPRPKSFREAPLKKRKRSEAARLQFWFWIKIGVNPIYLVIFFMVAPPISNTPPSTSPLPLPFMLIVGSLLLLHQRAGAKTVTTPSPHQRATTDAPTSLTNTLPPAPRHRPPA